MRFPIVFCFIIAGLLTASSSVAQHYYYIPNSTQIPVAKKRHDTGLGIGWSRNAGAAAVELQGYYSPINKVLVMANYMNAGDKEVLSNKVEGLKYRFFEVGAGVYEALPRGTASLLAGFGRGNLFNAFQGEEFVDMDIQRWFIQPGIMYNDAFFQGGICLRLSGIQHTRGKVAIAIPANDLLAVETIQKKSPFFLPEVGITGAMRLLPLILGVQVCGIFPRTDDLAFVRVNSSIFVSVELGNVLRGKKKPPVTE